MAKKQDERWKDREWATKRMRAIIQIAKETHPVRFANYYALRKVSWLLFAIFIGVFVLWNTHAMIPVAS